MQLEVTKWFDVYTLISSFIQSLNANSLRFTDRNWYFTAKNDYVCIHIFVTRSC